MNFKNNQAFQWGVAISTPVILALTIVGLYFFIQTYDSDSEGDYPRELIEVVVINKEANYGSCAWFFCQSDEFYVVFENPITESRGSQNVPETFFHLTQVGDKIPYDIANDTLIFD